MLVLSTALSTALVAPAGAADPNDRKRAVDRKVEAVQDDLHEHTRELAEAVRRLRSAESQLPAARRALREAAARVATARAKDAAAAARLSLAVAQERRARVELDRVRVEISDTVGVMGAIARRAYQRGGQLAELSVVLKAESPRELSERVAAVDTVLRSQEAAVERLADDRARMASRQARLLAVRDQVAALRRQAATRLAQTRAAQSRAQAAERRVSRLVEARQEARRAAAAAKADDERRYRQLQAESRRLQGILAARARQATASPSGGVPAGSGNLSYPASGPITSPYGMRVHPVTGIYKLHDGTDFGVGCGVPVHAAAAGTVVRTATLAGYGNQVALDHGVVRGVGLATSYNHLSGFAVRPGQRVSRGQVVGYVGSTGYSTGCHLHFMVYVNGATTNPMGWL